MRDSDDLFETPKSSLSTAGSFGEFDDTLVDKSCVDKSAEVHNSKMANEEPKPEVLARLKIPAFAPDEPKVWFQEVEWALKDVGVTTSAAKFRQVAKSHDGKYSKEVRNLIINPPAEGPYEKPKEEILRRLGKSQVQKIRQLLWREDIGDQKPYYFNV